MGLALGSGGREPGTYAVVGGTHTADLLPGRAAIRHKEAAVPICPSEFVAVAAAVAVVVVVQAMAQRPVGQVAPAEAYGNAVPQDTVLGGEAPRAADACTASEVAHRQEPKDQQHELCMACMMERTWRADARGSMRRA